MRWWWLLKAASSSFVVWSQKLLKLILFFGSQCKKTVKVMDCFLSIPFNTLTGLWQKRSHVKCQKSVGSKGTWITHSYRQRRAKTLPTQTSGHNPPPLRNNLVGELDSHWQVCSSAQYYESNVLWTDSNGKANDKGNIYSQPTDRWSNRTNERKQFLIYGPNEFWHFCQLCRCVLGVCVCVSWHATTFVVAALDYRHTIVTIWSIHWKYQDIHGHSLFFP